jgi:hypothetical protein
MHIEWIPIAISSPISFGLGFGASYFSTWLFAKRQKGKYSTTYLSEDRYVTMSSPEPNIIHLVYHGKPPEEAEIKDIVKQLWS